MDAQAEHPEADEIRRQVEYYFSDENLPTDMFLKKHMLESGNETVELKEILRFPKMRRYKPKSAVIATLRKSPILHISDDNKYISRQVPFIWPDSDIGEDYEEKEARWQARQTKQAQRSKVSKVPGLTGKLAAGMDKPTGFEDTFVDGPITPAEYAEERLTYDPDESISERLTIAIHRYSTRRKFHQNYALIFTSFMKYGGVEGKSKDFQGGGIQDEDLEGMAPGQIAHLKSVYDVGSDKCPDEGIWELDFLGVAKGFLSSRLPNLVLPDQYPLAIRILTNFYNYLLVHDVFDAQHEADTVASIRACISLCNLAAKELPKVRTAGQQLPGEFNIAASVLSNGFYAGLWTGEHDWAKEGGENSYNDEIWGATGAAGMPEPQARVVLSMGIAAHGDERLFDALESTGDSTGCHLVCLEERAHTGLQVLEVILADEETQNLYDGALGIQNKVKAKSLGKLICEEWTMPSFHTFDLRTSCDRHVTKPTRYEVWVEDAILQSVFPGMKLEATLRNLALGTGDGAPSFWTFDGGCCTYCSFFTYLPNELMTKEPKPIRWLRDGDDGNKDNGDVCQEEDDD